MNNAYRIGLLIRRLCCTPNADELDEFLYFSPVYAHPHRDRTVRTTSTAVANIRSRNKSKRTNEEDEQQQQQQATTSNIAITSDSNDELINNEDAILEEGIYNQFNNSTTNRSDASNIRSNNLAILQDQFNSSNRIA